MYIYIRWSSEKQTEGTTRERQLSAATAFAESNNLEVVETIEDKGVSAFNGQNTSQNANFGKFLKKIENNQIEKGSWLFVENLDRISRDNTLSAVDVFTFLINNGITLITGMDNKIYTKESLSANPLEFISTYLTFYRGHDESVVKRTRTLKNVDSLVARFFQGQPVNIKSVGKHPWWIDDSGSQYEAVRKHPQYWEIAQYCVKKFISGATAWSVFTDIQENHPDLAKSISYQKLQRMRKNRALIGEYTVNYENKTQTLKNYFPPLCSDDEFSILAFHINNNKQSRGAKTKTIKLLSGMRLFRCGHCEGTMDGTTIRGKIIYRCSKSISKSGTCTPWTISHFIVDHCVMVAIHDTIINHSINIKKKRDDITNKINSLEKEKNEQIQKQKMIEDLYLSGVNASDNLKSQLIEISKNINEINFELKNITEHLNLNDLNYTINDTSKNFLQKVNWDIFSNIEDERRNTIRTLVLSYIKEIVVTKINKKISIKIKPRYNDNILIFEAGKTKNSWVFHIKTADELESENYNQDEINLLINNLPEDIRIKINELAGMKAKLEQLSISAVYESIEILKDIGYPDIDGKKFWAQR